MSGSVTQSTDQVRRRFARLFFDASLEATLGGHPVRLEDFGRTGAGIEHAMPFSTGREATLECRIGGVAVRVQAQIVRCRLARRGTNGVLVYRSGLRFVDDRNETVLQAVAELLMERRTGSATVVAAASA